MIPPISLSEVSSAPVQRRSLHGATAEELTHCTAMRTTAKSPRLCCIKGHGHAKRREESDSFNGIIDIFATNSFEAKKGSDSKYVSLVKPEIVAEILARTTH
jgi:hypothetical protein